jgi:hypothetical protein
MIPSVDGYEVVCDGCAQVIGDPIDGLVTWMREDGAERAFALTHVACAPDGSAGRLALVRAASPTGFLRFVTERFAQRIADPASLAAVVSTLGLFVLRADTPAEMERLRQPKRPLTPHATPTINR